MSKPSDPAREPLAPRPEHLFVPELLASLQDVNERCLELIATAAKLPTDDAPFAIVGPLRSLLRSARAHVRRRAARQPLALVDLEFRDPEWWQAVKSQPTRAWKERAWRAASPRRAAEQLAHNTLVLAWHMSRADADATAIIFGMSREVVGVIASLRLSDLETIATHQFRHIRPRWEQQPELWRELLVAAHHDDRDAMRAFAVHALQRLAGEMIPRS